MYSKDLAERAPERELWPRRKPTRESDCSDEDRGEIWQRQHESSRCPAVVTEYQKLLVATWETQAAIAVHKGFPLLVWWGTLS